MFTDARGMNHLSYYPSRPAIVRLWRGPSIHTQYRRLRPGQLAELRRRFDSVQKLNRAIDKR